MRTILLLFDGAARSVRALDFVLDLAADGSTRIHVCSLEAPPVSYDECLTGSPIWRKDCAYILRGLAKARSATVRLAVAGRLSGGYAAGDSLTAAITRCVADTACTRIVMSAHLAQELELCAPDGGAPQLAGVPVTTID